MKSVHNDWAQIWQCQEPDCKTTIQVTGLFRDTKYSFRVASANEVGRATFGSPATFKTHAVPGRVEMPTFSQITWKTILLHWDMPALQGDCPVDVFKVTMLVPFEKVVYIGNGTGVNNTLIDSPWGPKYGYMCTCKTCHIEPDSPFRFKVAAHNCLGWGKGDAADVTAGSEYPNATEGIWPSLP